MLNCVVLFHLTWRPWTSSCVMMFVSLGVFRRSLVFAIWCSTSLLIIQNCIHQGLGIRVCVAWWKFNVKYEYCLFINQNIIVLNVHMTYGITLATFWFQCTHDNFKCGDVLFFYFIFGMIIIRLCHNFTAFRKNTFVFNNQTSKKNYFLVWKVFFRRKWEN